MEQIISLPWEGSLQAEIQEEAAQNSDKSIFVASNVVNLVKHLREGRGLPELMIVDSTWTLGLVSALDADLENTDVRDVPVIVTTFKSTSATGLLESAMNVVAEIDPLQQFTSRLPQLIAAFFAMRSALPADGRVTAALFAPAVQDVLQTPADDKGFFSRAMKRQDEKLALRMHA